MLKAAAFVMLAASAGAQDAPRQWLFRDGDRPMLEHVVPETDDRDFAARCVAKSGILTVMPARSVPGLAAGGAVTIGFAIDDRRMIHYPATGVMDDSLGAVVPVATLSMRDPNFEALSNGRTLTIRVDNYTRVTVPLDGIAAPLARFAKACAG